MSFCVISCPVVSLALVSPITIFGVITCLNYCKYCTFLSVIISVLETYFCVSLLTPACRVWHSWWQRWDTGPSSYLTQKIRIRILGGRKDCCVKREKDGSTVYRPKGSPRRPKRQRGKAATGTKRTAIENGEGLQKTEQISLRGNCFNRSWSHKLKGKRTVK